MQHYQANCMVTHKSNKDRHTFVEPHVTNYYIMMTVYHCTASIELAEKLTK